MKKIILFFSLFCYLNLFASVYRDILNARGTILSNGQNATPATDLAACTKMLASFDNQLLNLDRDLAKLDAVYKK